MAPSSPRVVNVKDKGAKGDGRTDDTAALQAAIDKIGGTGGTVFVPDGKYMIDAARVPLALKSDMTLKLSNGAVLKTIPNGEKRSDILTIENASNVTIAGGTLEGDRDEHLGHEGEGGMGVRIGPNARQISLSGVTARKMWGDGFYISGAKDVTLCSVTADFNRRQGLTVIEVNGLLVTSSVFSNTRGTRPSAGIDLEPNKKHEHIRNVRIVGSKFLDNVGAGVLIAAKKRFSNVADVEITRNLFTGILPIKIEYAPGVLDSAICHNRQIVPRSEPTNNMSPYAEPAGEVVLTGCGDPRIQIRRNK